MKLTAQRTRRLCILGLLQVVWFACGAVAVAQSDILARYTARYPEGVARIDGTYWFAEMAANQISTLRDGVRQSFAMPFGCGPTAVEEYGHYRLVLCHLNHRILLVSLDGTVVHSQGRSNAGAALYHPNDAVRDDRGGVYFSSSGDFADEAIATGRVFYLFATGAVEEVARGIHYANGVEFDVSQQRLLVSSHLGRKILAYAVLAQGRLGPATTLHDLGSLVQREADWRIGPDGLHLDADGTLRVALYGGSSVVVYGNASVRQIALPMQYPTTVHNDPRDGLFVGGVFDLTDRRLTGEVIMLRPGPAVMGR